MTVTAAAAVAFHKYCLCIFVTYLARLLLLLHAQLCLCNILGLCSTHSKASKSSKASKQGHPSFPQGKRQRKTASVLCVQWICSAVTALHVELVLCLPTLCMACFWQCYHCTNLPSALRVSAVQFVAPPAAVQTSDAASHSWLESPRNPHAASL